MFHDPTPTSRRPPTGGSTVDPVADASLGGAHVDTDTGTAQTVDFGPVPDDVTQVELAWSDGHRETVEINDGWWLAVRELTDATNDSWQPPAITRMVFADDAGTSVAEFAE